MRKLVQLTIIMFFSSASAYANSWNSFNIFSSDNFKISTSTGVLNGEAKELVYDPTKNWKVSQLDWKINNMPIIKLNSSLDIHDFLTFNVNGWIGISGSGYMDDYDWLKYDQSDWTHHSWHSDTTVNHAMEYDFNMKIWLLEDKNYKAGIFYKVGIITGYQKNSFSWTSSGGEYSYDNAAYVGSFPNSHGIKYDQNFTMPYIGIAGNYRINNFELSALLKFSRWVKANDEDHHYLRNLIFYEEVSNSKYYGASIETGYYFTKKIKIFGEFAYNNYKEGRGPSTVFEANRNNTETFSGESAGIANENYTIVAGIQYNF